MQDTVFAKVHHPLWAHSKNPFDIRNLPTGQRPIACSLNGISQVQDRVLRNLAARCARAWDVLVGPDLSDAEVLQRASRP